MPILTRGRILGLSLAAPLADLLVLSVLALALLAGGEMDGWSPGDPTGATALVSHAGAVLTWEGGFSNLLPHEGAWQAIERLIRYSSGASSIGS